MRSFQVLAATLLLLPAAVLAQEKITDGAYKSGLSGSQGSVQAYYLDVPDGATEASFSLSGGAGNADLYVNFGEPYLASGSVGAADCAPQAPSNEETCVFESPQAGRWYVELRGVTDYSDASLFGWSLTRLQSGVALPGITVSAGESEGAGRWFYLDVPSGATAVSFATRGGSGNPDLFIGDDIDGSADCVSASAGTDERCEVASPAAGRWYALVWSVDSYAGVSVTGTYSMAGSEAPGLQAQELGDTRAGGAMSPAALGTLLLLGLVPLLRRRSAPVP